VTDPSNTETSIEQRLWIIAELSNHLYLALERLAGVLTDAPPMADLMRGHALNAKMISSLAGFPLPSQEK
jgi:hypothetical protein